MILTSLEYLHDADIVVLPDHSVVHGSTVLLPLLRILVVPRPVGHSLLREQTLMCECFLTFYIFLETLFFFFFFLMKSVIITSFLGLFLWR